MTLLLILLLAAMFFDIRFFRIPNALIVIGVGAGAVYRCISPGEETFFYYLLSMAGMFLLLIPFYRLRAIGGGDVKLLSVCALFTGWERGLSIAVYALFFGGIFSVIYLVYHRIISKNYKNERHVIHFAVSIFLGAVMQCLWGGFLW